MQNQQRIAPHTGKQWTDGKARFITLTPTPMRPCGVCEDSGLTSSNRCGIKDERAP